MSASNRQPPATSIAAPGNVLLVYFFRNANFAGHGRTHLLQIDDKTIGRLSSESYYILEMWPGQYQISIILPREEFFGEISPPVTISRQITLKPHPSGNTYVCAYTDGMGSSGITVKRRPPGLTDLKTRNLARRWSARDTAQVNQFYKARYDGPASHGRPHGEGTLTWPDGSIYKGTFRHGLPTRKAKFTFPDGLIYMGPNYRGRPTSPGILMTKDGKILFAGNFDQEKPDGVGIRHGAEGPEFCEYRNGRDITKTFRQFAKEALDIEDRDTIDSRPDPIEQIATEIQTHKRRLAGLSTRHDPDKVRTAFSESKKRIRALEAARKRLDARKTIDHQDFLAQLHASRYERELAKAKEFRKMHQAKIDQERRWCQDEFLMGNNLCTCAPLADDFHTWMECQEPARKRYID